LIINDRTTPAVGVVTHLSGRILSESGEPIRNALVELWQADNNGAYIHSGTMNREHRDPNFQGYGRFLTDSKGQYYFRTIKPVAYPGRAPHIHLAVSRGSGRVLTTQLLIKGNPQNQNDGVFRELTDSKQRETVLAEFKPLVDSKIGELAANFEIIVGVTPEAPEHRHGPGPGHGPGSGPGPGPRP
jgi:protocatechuate 3,4-dioxygenase beta subunit